MAAEPGLEQNVDNVDEEALRTTADAHAEDRTAAPDAVALPLGAVPFMGTAFGAAGGLSPATTGAAPLSGGVLPLAAPLLVPGDAPAAEDNGALAGRVEQALVDDGRLSLHAPIAVAVGEGGVVELSGRVGSQHERQTAEQIVARLPGVAAVRNHLDVG